MKVKQIGYYDYTVILTYCGVLFAFYGILRVLAGDFRTAVICLMLSGVCDMFDGAVASTKKRDTDEKRFGIQIDSLSDLISFGVFPALFLYALSEQHPAAGGAGAFFVLAALIRLAFYNVLEEKRQFSGNSLQPVYLGLPVTTVAIVLPVVYILYDTSVFRTLIPFGAALLLCALGFLTPVEIKKPKAFGKLFLIIVGLLEATTVTLFMGWDML